MELIMGFKPRETIGCRRLLRFAPGSVHVMSSDSKAEGAFLCLLTPRKINMEAQKLLVCRCFHPFQRQCQFSGV